jgi:pyridoxamine 5'-phosphate oxidase
MSVSDPILRFVEWYDEALVAGVKTPDAMVLATATPDGAPSSRVVLYRGLSHGHLRFFTNYESRKGHEIAANPRAALLFHWDPQERQVRLEGTLEKLPPEESDEYFAARPRGHQLNAWSSAQSSEIAGREALLARHAEMEARFEGKPVPRPPYWGGYRLIASSVELWQGMADRMHHREVYRRTASGWERAILSP